jgi:CRP/FNR family transcriptional regulator, dissimilatory nitrate respiration regulator
MFLIDNLLFLQEKMDYSILSDSPLFKGLIPAEIESILLNMPHRIRKFSAGNMLSQSGETVNSLMVVLSGTVKGEMVDYAGRVIKIEDIHAPGALASAFMFGNKNMFPVNVIALTDIELLEIYKSDFLKLLMNNDKILVNFLDMISNRSQFLSEKIKFLNFKTIKSKMAQYILRLAGDQKNEIRLDRTQNDLADFFGVTRPSVARALGDMEVDGYLLVQGKRIKILNRKGLMDMTKD